MGKWSLELMVDVPSERLPNVYGALAGRADGKDDLNWNCAIGWSVKMRFYPGAIHIDEVACAAHQAEVRC